MLIKSSHVAAKSLVNKNQESYHTDKQERQNRSNEFKFELTTEHILRKDVIDNVTIVGNYSSNKRYINHGKHSRKKKSPKELYLQLCLHYDFDFFVDV